MYVDLCV